MGADADFCIVAGIDTNDAAASAASAFAISAAFIGLIWGFSSVGNSGLGALVGVDCCKTGVGSPLTRIGKELDLLSVAEDGDASESVLTEVLELVLAKLGWLGLGDGEVAGVGVDSEMAADGGTG